MVRTIDGYYGIVTSVSERTVFLSNGLEAVLEPAGWDTLTVLPLNIFDEDGGPASFIGLDRAMKDRCP